MIEGKIIFLGEELGMFFFGKNRIGLVLGVVMFVDFGGYKLKRVRFKGLS